MRKGIMLLPVVVSFIVFSQEIHGQNIIFGIQGGFPRQYETYKEYFEDGVLWGGGISTSVASILELGLGISHSDWDVVDGNKLEELSFSRYYTPLGWETRGHGTITEMCVSLRLLSRPVPHEKVSFFAQLGIGYYWVDLNASYRNPSLCLVPRNDARPCDRYLSYDRSNPGISFGVGAALRILNHLAVELHPSLRAIFAEQDRITYYSIDFALKYELDLRSTDEP